MTTILQRYAPRGTCVALMECRDKEVLLSGPAGTGKTRVCLEKMHLMALLNPGMRGLMVRKAKVDLTASALVQFREVVAASGDETGDPSWYGGSSQEPAAYRYSNGSVIVVGGLDNSRRIMSTQYDVIYVNEANELTEEDWERCTTRLRNGKVTFQQLIGDCNPDTPTHWLKARVDRGATTQLESRHVDNPVYFDDDGQPTPAGRSYVLGTLANLTGVRRSRLYDGQWAAAEGMIWDGWDTTTHLIDPFEVPDDWPRFWSIDFGMTHPFVCQRWAEDPDGRLYLYGEIYRTQRIVEDHAADLKRILEKEPRPRFIVADHDAEGRATFERHSGLSTSLANKNVTEGLQAVMSRLKVTADGKPRLMIMRGAREQVDPLLVEAKKPTCTADEIPGYVWADHATKEQPRKEQDDGCDALRYMVAERDLGARPKLRFIGQAF